MLTATAIAMMLRAKIRSFGGHENGDCEACGAGRKLPVLVVLALKVRATVAEVSGVSRGRICSFWLFRRATGGIMCFFGLAELRSVIVEELEQF